MEQSPHTALQLKSSNPARANISFQTFEKAKIQANAAQVLREIPKLAPTDNDVYTPEQAAEIVRKSVALFGGTQQAAPVPGFLERLEALERSICCNHCLHGLTSILYELERAIDLAHSDYVIQEFQCKVKLPLAENSKIKEAIQKSPLEIDCDICAQDSEGQLIVEKLKSFQFSAPSQIAAVQRAIDGLHKIKAETAMACRLHSKFTMPEEIQNYAREKNIEMTSDSPKVITAPQQKPIYQRNYPDGAINPNKIKINIPKKCIVCYEEVSPENAQFISDLEAAHVDYLNAGLSQRVEHYDLPSWKNIFEQAKARFRLVPGFFKKIIAPCVACMEEKQWSLLRTTLFELIAANDAPEDKQVVAFGAELFYDIESPTRFQGGPSFKVEGGKYKNQKGANVGYDLDVLLEDKKTPGKYSFIEATTGGLSVKEVEKFQSMGREMNAEVYMLHNFARDSETFERSAYWKHPACILLPNNTAHQLEWPLASRTHACLHAISDSKEVYNPIKLDLSHVHIQAHAPHIFEDLAANTSAIFKLIDATSHQADAQVFKFKIQAGILGLLEQEKADGRLGGVAFAIQFLNNLRCTIQDSGLRERYLNKAHQYAFDLDALLSEALII